MGERLTIDAALRAAPWVALAVVWHAVAAVLAVGLGCAVGFSAWERLGGSLPPQELMASAQVGLTLAAFSVGLVREWRESAPRSDEWLLDHGRGELVGLDEYGALWVLEPGGGLPPRTVLVVRDATPQPDGSHRRYVLRVPHDVQMPRDAVAWTFGFEDGSAYRPVVET